MNKTVTLATGETVQRIDHPSGLTVYVYPKADYRGAFAVFGTRYGSVDTAYVLDGKRVEVPAGIAHYLEHKLFENEDCHAFARYAKTGAKANAFTSFDQTAYHFTCTDQFEASLEILLDFVQRPYFTEQTVQKEQGIIGQEIRMRNDEPDWRVLSNLLTVLYASHPVRIDIAGTEESISHITPELLYGCYRTFYNLHNMVLAVSGNVTTESVLSVCDRVLKKAEPLSLQREVPKEPQTPVQTYIELRMPVSAPLFCLGYKCPVDVMIQPPRTLAAAHAAAMLLSAESSPLYADLLKRGLITDEFEGEFLDGRGYALFLFAGESSEPKTVAREINAAITRVREQGVDEERFAECRAAMLGHQFSGANHIESCALDVMEDHFAGREPGELTQAIRALTVSDVREIFEKWMLPSQGALSVVWGES